MCNLRVGNANITYAQVKDEFEQRLCRDEYKRNLQIKLQNLKFVKGTAINSIATELRNTIRALYGIQDSNIISDLAMNHLLSILDESLRGEAKIFQLTGNKTLKNLLEFVITKIRLQSLSHGVECPAIGSQNSTNDCLTRLENIMEKLLTDRISQNNRPFYSNCQKPGRFVGDCFALRKCFNCNEKGHIAKNCKKTHSAPTTINSFEGFTKEHLEPEQRTLINVRVSDKPVSFLYDTGSQYTIITRKTYESRPNKPPLSPFNSSGIGVDGHTFCFDGIVYLNFSFDLKEGGTYQVKHEPVLVSKEINFCTKNKNKFKSCQKNLSNV